MINHEPKRINALMRYLRDEKGLQIAGSAQKRKLMNMGYYHGYKGYRYIRTPTRRVPYTTFDELSAIYTFDLQLKAMCYPAVMQIETAVKNYVLEVLITMIRSDSFLDIYSKLLDNYKSFSTNNRSFSSDKKKEQAENRFKQELKRRLDLRNRIYKIQSDAYGKGNKIADHYLKQDTNLPIWAIFELLSLGEFGHFVSCLNRECRANISKELGICQSDDTNAMMPQRLIYITKDLRNAIAHNDVVFDTRFKKGGIDSQVRNAITNATGVSGLTFQTITDYIVLIVYQLKLLHIPNQEMRKVISSFENATEQLRGQIPISIYNRIIYTDNNAKMEKLKKFISLS